ncbi:hypothetical protein PIB30_075885 [Stylosanthes scabra]|uniref:Uncharacterized protein n=1 Tax=Stylosanthes scabra TaxID=79078 RepID=A0ABU6WND8_9FABA|nr:hypothetical protein [Stylosanthes scabra]
MASLLRKRKGKAVASTSEAPRFKTLYHESHFNRFFAAKEVLPEIRIIIDDDALSPISAQMNLRKSQRLTKPFLMVGYSLVREFYANAWRLEEKKNQPLTYTIQIRVLKLRDTPLPNAASHHDRQANNNLRLDEVLTYLCVEGAQWDRHLDRRPHYLRRTDLQPMARGWQMREMEQQGIPITMANLNIHRVREKEMCKERMRYEKVLEEVAAQKAKEKNKGKARGVEEDYDDEESKNEGGEW